MILHSYRKTILIFVTTIVTLLFLIWVLTFKTNMGIVISHIVDKWTREEISFLRIQMLGVLVVSMLGVTFGVLGYKISIRKRRNKMLWTILCVLFNFWAFLFLITLPSKKEE